MPSPEALEQIADIRIPPGRPVIICDVDEVVVHFIRGLENYLDRNGLWLHPQSFALNGNIKRKSDGEALATAELKHHLMRFFDEDIHRLEAIDGAGAALNALAAHAEVIMLTNLPADFRQARVENLAGHGLNFPVIANEGAKGPTVAALLDGHSAPAVFIDDIPNYLKSVRDHHPVTHLVHFMQDDRFGRHVEPLDYVGLRAKTWAEVQPHIAALVAL